MLQGYVGFLLDGPKCQDEVPSTTQCGWHDLAPRL